MSSATAHMDSLQIMLDLKGAMHVDMEMVMPDLLDIAGMHLLHMTHSHVIPVQWVHTVLEVHITMNTVATVTVAATVTTSSTRSLYHAQPVEQENMNHVEIIVVQILVLILTEGALIVHWV